MCYVYIIYIHIYIYIIYIYIYIYIIAEQKQRKDTVIVKQSSYESCITLISHAYTSSL